MGNYVYGFPSTGDPVRDEEISRGIQKRHLQESEGLCPNGCTMMELHPDGYEVCPSCGCMTFRRILHVGE